MTYCAWLANETGQPYRLPSEAEWEYAARAGTTTRYAFGDAITPKDANYSESKLGKTAEVGSYPPNAWGLHDMHGNVWEWVEDIYHDSYKGAPTNGTAWIDNVGEDPSRSRIGRGGSWYYTPWILRSAHRGGVEPDYRDDDRGFRVGPDARLGKGVRLEIGQPIMMTWLHGIMMPSCPPDQDAQPGLRHWTFVRRQNS